MPTCNCEDVIMIYCEYSRKITDICCWWTQAESEGTLCHSAKISIKNIFSKLAYKPRFYETVDVRDVKSENAERRLTFDCLSNIYIYVSMSVLLDRLPSC